MALTLAPDEPALKAKWFSVPDMGLLTATTFKIVLVTLAPNQSCTYLPLYGPVAESPIIVTLGNINNSHWVSINLTENSPLPTVSPQWKHHCSSDAFSWINPLQQRIQHYQDLLQIEAERFLDTLFDVPKVIHLIDDDDNSENEHCLAPAHQVLTPPLVIQQTESMHDQPLHSESISSIYSHADDHSADAAFSSEARDIYDDVEIIRAFTSLSLGHKQMRQVTHSDSGVNDTSRLVVETLNDLFINSHLSGVTSPTLLQLFPTHKRKASPRSSQTDQPFKMVKLNSSSLFAGALAPPTQKIPFLPKISRKPRSSGKTASCRNNSLLQALSLQALGLQFCFTAELWAPSGYSNLSLTRTLQNSNDLYHFEWQLTPFNRVHISQISLVQAGCMNHLVLQFKTWTLILIFATPVPASSSADQTTIHSQLSSLDQLIRYSRILTLQKIENLDHQLRAQTDNVTGRLMQIMESRFDTLEAKLRPLLTNSKPFPSS